MTVDADKFVGKQLVFVVAREVSNPANGRRFTLLAPVMNLETGSLLTPRPRDFPGDGYVFWWDVPAGDFLPGSLVVGRLGINSQHYQSTLDKSWFQVQGEDGRHCRDDVFEYVRWPGSSLDEINEAIRWQTAVQLVPRPQEAFYFACGKQMCGPLCVTQKEDGAWVLNAADSATGRLHIFHGENLEDYVTNNGGLTRLAVSPNTFKPGDDNAQKVTIEKLLIRHDDLLSLAEDAREVHVLSNDLVIAKACRLLEGRETISRAKGVLKQLMKLVAEHRISQAHGVFEGLQQIVGAVGDDSRQTTTIAAALMKHEKVKAKLSAAVTDKVNAQVDQKTEEIERLARRAAAPILQELEDAETSLLNLQQQIAERDEQLDAFSSLETDHQRRMDDIVDATAKRLAEHRAGLMADAGLLHSLMGTHTQPVVATGDETHDEPLESTTYEPVAAELEGEPVSERDFIGQRLQFFLRELGCLADNPRDLHTIMVAAPIVRFPHSGWARAYADAMGETAVMSVAIVEPDWMNFQCAWRTVCDNWQAAVADPKRLYLIGFDGINRCPSDAWLRPFISVVNGWTHRLPDCLKSPWPENVRLFLTLADGEETFSPPTDLNDWAIAPRDLTTAIEGTEQSEKPTAGYFPLSSWMTGNDVSDSRANIFRAILGHAQISGSPFRPLTQHTVARMINVLNRLDRQSTVHELLMLLGLEEDENAPVSQKVVS